MGKINEVTGNLTGLVGTVVLSSWKGIKYIRHKGKKSKKKPSEKQLRHRAQIRIMSKFLYSMNEWLDQSFASFAHRKTGTNAAFSYNFKNGIMGEYPTYQIAYPMILVSRGDLMNITDPVVVATGNGELQFSWTDNSGIASAKPGDICIAVVHCPSANCTICSDGKHSRQSGSMRMNIPEFRGKTVESWLAVLSADGKESAESIYTGQVEM